MKTSLFISGSVIILGALAICLWPEPSDAPAVSGVPKLSTRYRATQATREEMNRRQPDLAWQWRAGSAVSYDFASGTVIDLGDSNEAKVNVTGCWHVLVMDDGQVDGTVDLATVFTDVRYMNGEEPAVHFADLLEQIPCLLELNRDGAIHKWRFPDYLRSDDRQMLAGLNSVQVQLAAPDHRGFWVTEEQDTNGTIAVRYSIEAAGLVRKQRNSFTRLNAHGIFGDSTLRIAASDFTATIGPVWLNSFAGEETMEFVHQGDVAWRSRQHLNLAIRPGQVLPESLTELTGCASAAAAIDLLKRDLPQVIQMAGSGSVSEMEAAATRKAQHQHIDFATMMRGFEEAMASATSQADRQPAIEALRDWLLARPEEAGKLAGYLANPALPEESSACLFNALELSSASPASQAVLATVLSDLEGTKYSTAALIQAAVAAGGVGEITDQNLMDKLYQLSFTLDKPAIMQASDSALLSLGILSRTNPSLRERLATDLATTLEATGPVVASAISSALMTLANGNIHNDNLVASAARIFANSSNETLRSEALAYLHHSGSAASATAALADGSTVVQTRALQLLTEADEVGGNDLAAMTALLRNPAADEAVRATAAQLIKRYESAHPEIAEAYRAALAQNPPQNLGDLLRMLSDP